VRAFVATCGILFGLIVVAHVARMIAEPRVASEPWFWLLTVIAAALSAWAWRLFWTSRHRGR